jgi:hypothetical protein
MENNVSFILVVALEFKQLIRKFLKLETKSIGKEIKEIQETIMLILLLANDTKMITQTYNYKYFIKIKFFLVNI